MSFPFDESPLLHESDGQLLPQLLPQLAGLAITS